MVAVLVILDGASEPLRDGEPTSLELARTPALDRLAREGELTRLRTIGPGLTAGSEAAIPALLGWTPPARVDRGAIEAAAYGIAVPPGERAWRVDVVAAAPPIRADSPAGGAARSGEVSRSGGVARGGEVSRSGGVARGGEVSREGAVGRGGEPLRERALARAADALRAAAPQHHVHRLSGHRLLLVGRSPLPAAALAPGLRVWPEGIVPPRVLGSETVVVGACGAATGIARLMGAEAIVPAGATGLPGSDLAAKAAAAIRALAGGAACVVVHVGGTDEASHRRDRPAKIASIEAADRELVAALAQVVARAGGTLTVCPDHGCDPATGEHDAAPVPCVTRSPKDAALLVFATGARRLTERAVASLPPATLPAAKGLAA